MLGVLDDPVLVLNRCWQPIHTCSVRRALHLVCLGRAQVVQVDGEARFATHDFASWLDHSRGATGEGVVHGISRSLWAPRVVVLALYDKLPRLEVKFTRRNVFLRDQFTCQYCSKVLPEQQINLDHVIPRDKGGRTTWDNIVTSCVRCNSRKANKLPHEVGMHPVRKPFAPRWRPLFGLQEGSRAHASWGHFIGPERDDVKRSA
jgi:5-methylcytosine-specific restriction endonuclease McrA